MTVYSSEHRFEIIAWVAVGVVLLVFLVWYWFSKPKPPVRQVSPVLRPRLRPDNHSDDLTPPPRAFAPAPLYGHHKRDVSLPDDEELERRADGYIYPKRLNDVRFLADDMLSRGRVLSIVILYGIFLAMPLLFFIPYIIFKTSEREKADIAKEERKRTARRLEKEKQHSIESEEVPAHPL